MSKQMTFWDSPNAISSPELAAGPFALPDGLMTLKSGQALAHANHSAPPEKGLARQMIATFGLSFPGSLASAALQSALESRLQASAGLSGSTLFQLTWKTRVTPSQRRICALRARALFTSGSASGGLPTPSGTSNHGLNHVAGRLDEWGGSSNPFRGTNLGPVHCPGFELWVMGYPETWLEQMPPETPSSRKSRRLSSVLPSGQLRR